jgi:hypothetical protein
MGYPQINEQICQGNRNMAEHKHGSMEIKDQEKTFQGFMAWTKWTVIVIFAVLIYLAIFWH